MVNSKLKIGFELINTWNQISFQQLMKQTSQDVTQIEVFLITFSENTNKIDNVKSILNLDSAHVIQVDGPVEKLDVISSKGIMIYLDADNSIVNFINDSIPLINTPQQILGCQAIQVNRKIPDIYKLQEKWITFFQFLTGELSKNLPNLVETNPNG